MAGRPLGALTIAVLAVVLTSRIGPGDARFFVLQAQPEQEDGIETNTYYLVNAAGVGTVRTYSSASQSLNTFSFGSPFAWFQQQLQIMESLQQAALQSLMSLQGQQPQDQGNDPTRSDDLSQSEMLQRVGCQRMRAAMMQQMQEAGTLPRSRSDAATQTEEYFDDYDGLPALTKHSYGSSSSSASSDSLYASTYSQQHVQQQQQRYEVQQQQEQQAAEWWAHQMDRATDMPDPNQHGSDGYGTDDSDSAALDEAERAMDYAADRIMGLLSYLYRGYGEQEEKQQQQQQGHVPDDVTPGWGAGAVEGQGVDQGDEAEGSGNSVLGFHLFIQSMMQQLLEDSLERSYDEEGSYDDQGSYDEEDSYSDSFTRADWTRRDWDEYYDSLYSNVGSNEADGDDYSGVLTLADAVLAHMELEDDYSYFDGDWIDLVDAYRFGGYDDGSYAEGGDGDADGTDTGSDDYASGIAPLVARSSAAGRQQRYSDGRSSSSSSNGGSVTTEAIMSTDLETGVTEVVAWSNVGAYVLQFLPTHTTTSGDGYAYAQGRNPGEPFGGLWPFSGDASGPQLPQEPVIVVNQLNMGWFNADGSFNWGLLVLVLLLAATGAMVVTFVMSWLSLRRTMRAGGCGGWVYAPRRYRGGKGGGKGWDALDEPLVLQPADCKGAMSLGVEEAAAYVPPKVANESVATALTK